MNNLKNLNTTTYYKNARAKKIAQAKLADRNNVYYQTLKLKVLRDNMNKNFKRDYPTSSAELQMMSSLGSLAAVGSTVFIGRKTGRMFDKSTEAIETITQTVVAAINSMQHSLTAACTRTIDMVSFIKDLIISISNIYMTKDEYFFYSLIMNFVNLASRFLNIDIITFGKQLYDSICWYLGIQQNPQVQFSMGDFESLLNDNKSNWLKLSFFGIVVMFYVCILGRCPGKTDCESMMNRMGNLARSTFSMKQMYSTLDPIFEEAKKFVKSELGLREPSDLDQLFAGYEQWEIEVERLAVRHDELTSGDRILRDKNFVLRIEKLYQESLEFSRELAAMRVTRDVQMSFMTHQRMLTDLYKQVDVSGVFGEKPRTKPVVIWLYGESQIGKSGMTWPLAIELNNQLLTNKKDAADFSKHVYFRNVEQEFWDNYKHQNIVVYDDFGQCKDNENAPNAEFMEVIRSANIAPYPLHCAGLAEKNKTKFTSKAIILTSNKKDFKINSLTFPDAVLARISVCGRVYLKPEYTTLGWSKTNNASVERLDKAKARGEKNVPINTDVYLIDLINAESNEPIKIGLNYQEFKDHCVTILNAELKNSLELTQYLSQYAAEKFEEDNPDFAECTQGEIQIGKYVVNLQGDLIGEAPSTSELELMGEDDIAYHRLFDEVCVNKRRTVEMFGLDVMHNILKVITVECNPIIHTVDFFTNALRFEQSELQKQYPELTRWAFYKKSMYRRVTQTVSNIKDHLNKMRTDFVGTYNTSPFGCLCVLATTCLPILALLYKMWPSSFKFERASKSFYTCTQTTRLPHLTISDFDEMVSQIQDAGLGMAAISVDKFYSADVYEALETMLDRVPWLVTIVFDRPNDPIDIDRNNFVVKELLRHQASRLACSKKPDIVRQSVEIDGTYSIAQPFAQKLDFEISTSGDDMTRKAKLNTYMECFKTLEVRSVKDKDLLLSEIELAQSGDHSTVKPTNKTLIELAQSGDAITRKPTTKTILELAQSGDNVTRKQQIKTVVETSKLGEVQLLEDVGTHQIINHKILKNLYALEMYKRDQQTQTDVMLGKINILFVRGTLAITPKHISYVYDKCDKIVIRNCFDCKYEMMKENIEIKPMTNCLGEDMESCMINFLTYVPAHSDLVSQFSSAKTMSLYTHMKTLLPTIKKQKDRYMPYIYVGNQAEASEAPVHIADCNDPTLQCVIRRGMTYTAATERGDCGAPLMIDNKMIAKKIIGIHVVGKNAGRCLAECITQKDLERGFKDFAQKAQIQLHDEMVEGYYLPNVELPEEELIDIEAFSSMVPCDRFVPIGKCSNTVYAPGTTEIRESLVHNMLEPITTKPAHLRPIRKDGMIFDIKQQMLKKAAMDTPYIPKFFIDEAYEYTKAKLLKNAKPEHKRILTLEESVCGIAGEDYIGPICRSTSPGYPWVLDRKEGSGKQQWLGSDEYFIDDDLRAKINTRLDLAKQGIRLPCVWVDTLKDERRPIEKVDAGKTRVFAVGPQDFTLLYRQYFLGFVAHVMENRIYNEQSLGTNCYSEEWGMTAKYLQEVGPKVIAGDFQTFDGTLNSCILEKFVDCVNEFYDDGELNALVRQVLFREIVNSIHLFPEWQIFYAWTHSQTSGSPTTTPVNSFYNSMGMRITFRIAAMEHRVKVVMADFDKYVRMVSYGDDDVVNISDMIIGWYNQHTITNAFAKIGMIYTDEAKTGDLSPKFRNIDEVSYLKRKFIFDDETQTWLAPLDISVVMEMPNWIRGERDPIEATKQNCEAALRELMYHSRETFEKQSKKIKDAFYKQTGIMLTVGTYDAMHYDRLVTYFLDKPNAHSMVTHLFYNFGEENSKA